jgi:tetratricopeptide (TPR) repeat protein/O-antigen ligase
MSTSLREAASFQGPPDVRAAALTELLLLAALVAAPLLGGTVHIGSTLAVVVLCLAGAWLARAAGTQPAGSASPLGIVLGLVLVWQALSLLPLPADLAGHLVPRQLDLLDWSTLEGLVTARLSHAPGATAWELLKLSGAMAAFLLVRQIARREGGRRRVVQYVIAAGAAALVVSLLQTLTSARSVLWLYRPESESGLAAGTLWGFRTPFVNPNHAAQFFELTGLAALGLGVLGPDRRRLLWLGLGLAMLLAVIATGSLASWVAIAAGVGFLVSLAIARSWRPARVLVMTVPLAVLATAVVIALPVVRAGLDDTALGDPFTRVDRISNKVRAWPATVQLIDELPWTGIGRGAFRDIYPQVQEAGFASSRSFVENEWLQVLVELGLPVGGMLLLALSLTWLLALVRWRDSTEVGAALAATLAVGIHGFVDFGPEFAGVGLPLIGLLALCTAGAGPGRGGGRGLASFALLVLATLGLLAAPWALRHGSHGRIHAGLMELPEGADLAAASRGHLRWRPLSPDVALALAGAHEVQGEINGSLRWLSRAMYLAPSDPSPHVYASRILAALDYHDQALIELRLGLELYGDGRDVLFRPLLNLTTDPDEVERALGFDPEAIAAFVVFALRQDRRSTLARELARRREVDAGASPALLRAVAEVAIADGEPARAEPALRQGLALEPDDLTLRLTLARCLQAGGDLDGARSTLQTGLALDPDNPWMHAELGRIEVTAGAGAEARRQLRLAWDHAPAESLGLRSGIRITEGDLARADGDLLGARDAYLGALRLEPEMARNRVKLGDVYRDLGHRDAALREYERARVELPDDSALERRIQDL